MDRNTLEEIGFTRQHVNFTYMLKDGNHIFIEKGDYPYLCLEGATMKYLHIKTIPELKAFIKIVDG
jgi:hypothetical protein